MHRPLTVARNKTRAIALGLAASVMVFGNIASVGAAALNTASISLGDPQTGATTTYTVDAAGFSTGTGIACVKVDLGANPDGSGAISNLDTSSSTFDSSTLITAGSWSVDNTASAGHELRITHNTATENPAANGDVVWGGIVNGDTEGTTYYGVLDTYTNVDCSTGPTDSVIMAFIYKDGELVTLTIAPTLTFTCNGVGTTQLLQPNVPGTDDTTHASTGSGIDYSTDVTAVANGYSAHDLDVATNADGGYDVFIRQDSAGLTNGTDVIDPHTGTNATPTVFPAAGTEAWGYTSDDADLSFGADQYAGMPTTNEQVVTNASATAGTETTRVGHQVGIANTTPAGVYQSTLIYTIVATY